MIEKIWSLEYEHAGKLFSLQILGTELEAISHANNLGLSDPELIVSNLPFEFETSQLH